MAKRDAPPAAPISVNVLMPTSARLVLDWRLATLDELKAAIDVMQWQGRWWVASPAERGWVLYFDATDWEPADVEATLASVRHVATRRVQDRLAEYGYQTQEA